jgi:hypothetical protein
MKKGGVHQKPKKRATFMNDHPSSINDCYLGTTSVLDMLRKLIDENKCQEQQQSQI